MFETQTQTQMSKSVTVGRRLKMILNVKTKEVVIDFNKRFHCFYFFAGRRKKCVIHSSFKRERYTMEGLFRPKDNFTFFRLSFQN